MNGTSSSAATHGSVDRVEVMRFALVKTYDPVRFAAAAKELDGDAKSLAAQQQGTLASSATVQAAGGKARSYVIDFDGKTEQITFVLDGKQEYELVCRRATGDSATPCTTLVSSFTLS